MDQGGLFSYIAPEARVPTNHPLRKIRELVRDVLGELNRSLGRLYASEGRPSIPPEQLLSALLLQVRFRRERLFMAAKAGLRRSTPWTATDSVQSIAKVGGPRRYQCGERPGSFRPASVRRTHGGNANGADVPARPWQHVTQDGFA